jgi:type I restriction enzyme R subunit
MTNLIDNKVTLAIKLDDRNNVEKPLLDQLAGLGWEILDLDSKQLKIINDRHEDMH